MMSCSSTVARWERDISSAIPEIAGVTGKAAQQKQVCRLANRTEFMSKYTPYKRMRSMQFHSFSLFLDNVAAAQ
jgi:hypothetical protein